MLKIIIIFIKILNSRRALLSFIVCAIITSAVCAQNNNDSTSIDSHRVLHEYVDLGLPSGTLWATCNVGADKPEQYGDYFAWGDTSMQCDSLYSISTYSWYEGTPERLDFMRKYETTVGCETFDNLSELLPEDDAATLNWGDDWCMPSREQVEELIDCECTYSSKFETNGVKGTLITSRVNGNSVFFPACGSMSQRKAVNEGECSGYWTRSLWPGGALCAYILYFQSEINYVSCNRLARYLGYSVRPVRKDVGGHGQVNVPNN